MVDGHKNKMGRTQNADGDTSALKGAKQKKWLALLAYSHKINRHFRAPTYRLSRCYDLAQGCLSRGRIP